MIATRRQLRFASLDEVVRDAGHLLAVGYDKPGNWDLSQVCRHLADWLRYPVDGYPPVPMLARPVLAVMRATVVPRMLRKTLATGVMGPGGPTMKQSVHPPGDPAEAVAALEAAADKFAGHAGEYLPSPLIGRLDRGTMTRIHLIHCAHHLGFLVPKA